MCVQGSVSLSRERTPEIIGGPIADPRAARTIDEAGCCRCMMNRTESLARKLCRDVARQQASRRELWVKLADLDIDAQEEAIVAALVWANGRNWIRVSGQPAHSVVLTQEGLRIAGRH